MAGDNYDDADPSERSGTPTLSQSQSQRSNNNNNSPMRGSTGASTVRGSTSSSLYNDLKSGLEVSKNSLRSSIEFITSQIQTAKEHYNSRIAQKSGTALEPREVYPRMPWHDLQASVTGLVARDIASHFVQVRMCDVKIYYLTKGKLYISQQLTRLL